MAGPAGYAWLIARYRLKCADPYHLSEIATGPRSLTYDGHRRVYERFPPDYDPGDGAVDHLVFALKYDGVALGVLARVFAAFDPVELRDALVATPNGKYLRRLWFFYEWLTDQRLELEDLHQAVAYVDALDPDDYFTAAATNVPRQRVRNNLLGSRAWCPQVRKTSRLAELAAVPWAEQIEHSLAPHDPDLLRRAVSYLYTKETRKSFELEGERVDSDREARFVDLLQRGPRSGALDKQLLIELQNIIVVEAYRESDYRGDQTYIGSNAILWQHKIHYVCPRPEDVPAMMEGLLQLAERLTRSRSTDAVDPVVAAAVIAFGFVYIHPFDDGNGRIHRYLIHFMLHCLGFCPDDLILPVSAAILRDKAGYDMVLEEISRPLLRIVRHKLDELGIMTATDNDASLYAYLDLTPHAEALYGWVQETIRHDLVEEIDILKKVDDARRRMSRIIDMPDRKRELFLRLCIDNNLVLSQAKRKLFAELSDEQVTRLQRAVAAAFRGASREEDLE